MNKLVFKLFYCKMNFLVFFIVLAVFLTGCSKLTGNAVRDIPREEHAKNPEAYFCPREDCGKVYESYISSANFSVHCAFYDINLKNVISSLARKSRNADVKI